jgi:hypothetical protein
MPPHDTSFFAIKRPIWLTQGCPTSCSARAHMYIQARQAGNLYSSLETIGLVCSLFNDAFSVTRRQTHPMSPVRVHFAHIVYRTHGDNYFSSLHVEYKLPPSLQQLSIITVPCLQICPSRLFIHYSGFSVPRLPESTHAVCIPLKNSCLHTLSVQVTGHDSSLYSARNTFWPVRCSSGRLGASHLYDSTMLRRQPPLPRTYEQ